MSAWETLWKILGEEFADLADFEQTARAALRLLLAAALGAVLGYEREQSGKAAGLRTHMLVTLGAALFVMPLQLQSGGADALSRVIQGTVAGIGFLCAGTWASTAIGVAVGLGHQGTAVLGTVLALLVLHVLACLNRSPPSSDSH
ncbi:MgtC/SapB family protein [Pseudomonas aeruginosa]|uniref:MgtC/SapB family protein n=1 Tax=Pseudomonas aeruginosa TaxID=287 RepID=UPI00071BABBC|nr:MgtC/SapB family protein [Pseudomonas aeruginosa]KSR20934.1 methyltransferase [Pseudomonas aeruginosa]